MPKIIHGYRKRNLKRTKEYVAWGHMIARCANPNYKNYHRYGGRGISVCESWLSFENFLSDVGLAPSELHSLDRYPNNNGNYEPGNVRWATPTQQARNMRSNVMIEWKGETLCASEWAERFGVRISTIQYRAKMGYDISLRAKQRRTGASQGC